MKRTNLILYILLAVSATAMAGDYAIMVQESPAGSGEITPGTGVHSYSANEVVTLTTAPKTGYHFVYWLGDVSDPTSNRTTMSVDGPKIIIAVFERDSYELPTATPQKSVGPEALFPTSMPSTDSSAPIYKPEDHDDPPVDPPPVPEPTTIALLATGAFLGLRKRLAKK